ncbi:MMPL family transporter [Paenibacillus sp. 481]|uniref:MMPL family transporter n=1 Tax=Paenibacillus sp. 481 TaxID=2835869 RepID=UPI001E2D4849|nr:MMPL family transporter [Paenibacillus sp. 481]UHA72470.1 MMPL family transporter [Paenibacillus sp. 481]
MKKIRNLRIASIVAWILITVVIVMTMPNLNQLVREKGQVSIPDSAQSKIAHEMLSQMDENSGNSYSIIAVFNSGTDKPLTSKQQQQIESVIAQFKAKQKQLGIENMLTHLDDEHTKSQLVSKDKTTILTQLSVSRSQGTISEAAKPLEALMELEQVDTYLTGNSLVIEDFVKSTEEGIKKTEIIAVIFIILVLIIVFRSPIVPVVSLLTVGISYIVSLGIVAHFVEWFNYPFSNFTQVFLVVILFGIGTDYNILLFSRFKEELTKQDDTLTAVKATYRSAGKTVLYSALAVFIGFMALILAEFGIYQASSAVAIGVAVLVLVLMTLNPVIMLGLGKKLFWPVKKFDGHGESRIWGTLAKASVARPIAALLFIAILCIPFIVKYSDSLSYNDLLEVDDSYASKQGIQVIEKHYSPGFSSPTTLVIQSDKSLNNAKSLQELDELAERISNMSGVAEVFTTTRPVGKKMEELYMKDQSKELNKGLGDAAKGVGEINDGLSSAEKEIGQADTKGVQNVQLLIDGTNEVQTGVTSLGKAIEQLSKGVDSGASGAKQLESGLGSLKEQMNLLSRSLPQLQQGYIDLETGLSAFGTQFASLELAIGGAAQGFEQIEITLGKFVQSNPDMDNDEHIQTALGIAATGKQQMKELAQQLSGLKTEYDKAMSSFKQANASLSAVNDGVVQLQTGVTQLHEGSSSLQAGLQTAADGSKKMIPVPPALRTGLAEIHAGQKQLLSGLTELTGNMEKLQSGLSASTKGLEEVSTGLADAQSYLHGLSESKASEKFFIPQDVLESDDFKQALDMYMSPDRKTVQMNIMLKVNPYSKEAMAIVKQLNTEVQAAIKGSELKHAKAALGGKTSENVDLEAIASGDFARTATIMLIGIGLVLIFITRSLWIPIFIILSLVLAYFTSLGISEFLSSHLLSVNELGWNVPFFSFIMIVALGVDYSIFLMMRYRELEGHSTKEMIEAARHMGGVVISAAIILGGTFAALIPSGVLTLIEVAMTVMIGLCLLGFVMLPVMLPALLAVVERVQKLSVREK